MSVEKQNLLSPFLAFVLGINIIVGAGVFTMPITLYKFAGPAGLLSIGFAAICALFIGLCFARVASIIPESGGFYTYVSRWGGKFLGSIASIMYLGGLSFALGVLTYSAANVIAVYMTGISTDYIGYFIIACSFIATLFASSMAKAGQVIFFVLTIFPIAMISFLSLKTFSMESFVPFFENGINGVLLGTPSVLFSFLGLEAISTMARLVRNPAKTIPITTILSIITAAILYIVFVFCIFGGIEKSILMTKANLSEVLLYSFPGFTWIVHFINISIIITILGTVYSLMLSLSELLVCTIDKVSESRFKISEILAIVIVSLFAIFAMKFCKSTGKAFEIICILVVTSYLLVTMYLIRKPKRTSDLLLGSLGATSCIILIFTAILQLI